MSTKRSQRWTWMLIRGADRPAVQFSIPALLITFAGIAIIVSIAAAIILFIAQTASLHTMRVEQAKLESDITEKQDQLATARRQLSALMTESNRMKERMDQVAQWEQQQQHYLRVSGEAVPSPAGSSSGKTYSFGEAGQLPVGGEYIQKLSEDAQPSDSRLHPLTVPSNSLADTHRQLRRMEATWREWMTTIPALLAQAETFKQRLDSTPTFWPTDSTYITSRFGSRSDPFYGGSAFHAGLDIGGDKGDPVYAAADGKVIASNSDKMKGNYLIIDHGSSLTTRYLHLSERSVRSGEQVNKGQRIGKMGSTGRSTGAHLHFEVRQGEEAVDPAIYLGSGDK
ncbi:M23 family metallopeptidase [Paenibacillus thiaminolyticus]|uniref:M23 family metallopeptidase n=1 Tax=Paenibacillus thiaminolyticus TaxID=49283 RepID=UPI00234FC184|nr:M23 family metallopeptidase [Paenibacillus thiaminolyticus]WCR29684.1 M23 family metallopeptidase [Paenibacillus thiaminolyticus]